jgi:hypothetical protein|tara:strand:+ start:1280 stop:1588 length:309 start_codon:yes stop_codon:yes gene_type:complete
MPTKQIYIFLFGLFVAISASSTMVLASEITATCTGMFDLDIYNFVSEKKIQVIEKLGEVQFVQTEGFITLDGSFGEMRFDLNSGTLYANESDTGLYCTYRGL